MSPIRRLSEALRRLRAILGAPGLLIGCFAFLSFGFGLYVLVSEYNRPRQAAHDALHLFLRGWARAPDYLGLTLIDYVDLWRHAPPDRRAARLAILGEALRDLGDELSRQNERLPLFRIVAMEVRPRGGEVLAHWRASALPGEAHAALRETIPLAEPGGGDREATAIDLMVRCQVSPSVEQAAIGLETSYHRLLLAVLGLSGYSLLCLAYMIFHARALSVQVAREAAQEAALDLADRTCHELGNGVFVLANERKNLTAHLDLIDRFVDEDAEARAAAARRLGIEPDLSARWEHALKREYAARGIDPDLEIRGSAAMARQVCRQIAVCSEYIALTVRELDGFLKRTPLPVAPERVAVAEVFDEALALLGPRLEADEARVERPDARGYSPWVRADRRLLVHALVNLLKNALEAAAAVGIAPRITLSARVEGETIWIAVADNGPGIPEPDLRHVFDADFSTKGPGRGRGLAIVHESVQLQGGEIRVSSTPGAGTRFEIGLTGGTHCEA
jgi:signal transduction histidine kinase